MQIVVKARRKSSTLRLGEIVIRYDWDGLRDGDLVRIPVSGLRVKRRADNRRY